MCVTHARLHRLRMCPCAPVRVCMCPNVCICVCVCVCVCARARAYVFGCACVPMRACARLLVSAHLAGISMLVASGDFGVGGNTNQICHGQPFIPTFPASSPYVTAVGGTWYQNPGNHVCVCACVCMCKGAGSMCLCVPVTATHARARTHANKHIHTHT